MKKMPFKILTVFVLFVTAALCATCLTACDPLKGLDLSAYTDVVYNAMGGMMDYQPERKLKALPGSLIPEPKGGASGFGTNLQEAKKTGFDLEGWYTKIVAENYIKDSEGSYVKYYKFTLSTTGNYVGYPVYVAFEKGDFVAKKGADYETSGEVIYELYDAESDKTHVDESSGETVESIYTEEFYIFDDSGNLQKYSEYTKYELYDESNPDHNEYKRYTAEDAYVTYDPLDPSHTGLDRYEGDFQFDPADKWDFAKDKVGSEAVTLYARWIKKYKVIWDFGDGTSSEFVNGSNGIVVEPGKTIQETEVIPRKSGFTFLCWTDTAGNKWDFGNDVFPDELGVNSITLVASFIEGEYTRLKTVSDLLKVGVRPTADYMLAANIDLGGATGQPFGMNGAQTGTVFSGKFLGNGFSITNFIIEAENKTNMIANPKYYRFGLFTAIGGAEITDLSVEYTVKVANTSRGPLYLGGIAGFALGDNTISGCSVKVRMESDTSSSSIRYGEIIGFYDTGATVLLTNNFVSNEYAFGRPDKIEQTPNPVS